MPKAIPGLKPITTYLEEPLFEELKQVIKQAGVYQQQAINDAVRAYLPTLRAIATTRNQAIGRKIA